MLRDDLPNDRDVRQAVEAAEDRCLESLQWTLREQQAASFDDLREAITETVLDDCLAIDLNLDQRLDLVEEYADEYDLQLDNADIGSLRSQIESLANLVVHRLGEALAETAFRELQEFMEEHDFELTDIVESNSHGWACHYAERSEGDKCQVYEYRNLEGEGIHVDVWEYRLAPGWKIYLERWLEKGSLSPAEETFDAT